MTPSSYTKLGKDVLLLRSCVTIPRPVRIFCRRALKGEVCITTSDFSQSRLSQSVGPGGAGTKRILLLKIQPLYSYPPTCHTQLLESFFFLYEMKKLVKNSKSSKNQKQMRNAMMKMYKTSDRSQMFPTADISTCIDRPITRLINQNK